MYYNIWDSLPDPMWNAPFYASCDLLLSISKQTYGINKRVLKKYGMEKEDWAYKYIPHGVSKLFKPLPSDDSNLVKFKEKYGLDKYDFVVLWNNRNIRRKVPGDMILAFNEFAERYQDKKLLLFMHTQPVDDNGTDISEVIKHNGKFGEYKFTDARFSTEELNLFYNSGDVILNIASNEGFGLASCEALRAGTPIVVNVGLTYCPFS
jgi:glycosyltransferase involved in cell wall biosynthesis